MVENKEKIVTLLEVLLKYTRAGENIVNLVLNEKQDEVTIIFNNGYCKKADIGGDSGIAIIRDVVSKL